MTDLLEIVNHLAEMARAGKEIGASLPPCECGNTDWLNAAFFVYRGDAMEVAINFDQHTAMKLAFKVAAEMFDADQIGLIIDGKSMRHGGNRTIALAINRAGEMLWKVEPYWLSNRNPMWTGAEVPDEFPLADPMVAIQMHEIMKRRHNPVPLGMQIGFLNHPGLDVTPEHVRAMLDTSAAQAMDRAEAVRNGITKVSFFAKEGTPRAEIMATAGMPVEMNP